MRLEVKVSDASLDDVIATVVNDYDEVTGGVTLGDAVLQALLDRLVADPRWGDIGQRFAEAADVYLAAQAPRFVEALVAGEVTRQLESTRQGAVTRGEPSTRAEAIVATEVTTQLRAQFAPVVERALRDLRQNLNTLSDVFVQDFLNQRKGSS
jgi:hypothetical protein